MYNHLTKDNLKMFVCVWFVCLYALFDNLLEDHFVAIDVFIDVARCLHFYRVQILIKLLKKFYSFLTDKITF